MKLCEITKKFLDCKTARPQDCRTRAIHLRTTVALLFTAIIMTTAAAQPRTKVAAKPAMGHDWREGYVNITELTGAVGLGSTEVPYSKSYFGITTVNGYQFSRNIKAGIGVGVHKYNGGTLFPLYFDGRYSFSAQQWVPFFAAAAGWALSIDDLNGQSRLFINPSVGVRFVSIPKAAFTFSTGLMMQSGGGESRSSFINFKLGVDFKGKEWNL